MAISFSSLTVRRRSRSSIGRFVPCSTMSARLRRRLSGFDGDRLGCGRQSDVIQCFGVSPQEGRDRRMLQPCISFLRGCRPDCRVFQLLCRGQHFLRTIGKAVHLACATGTPFPFLEAGVDAAQHRLKRNAGILPDLHQRPVERRQNHQRAAALLKVLFDFGEIVEVVIQCRSGGARLQACRMKIESVPALAAEVSVSTGRQRLKPISLNLSRYCTPEGVLHPGLSRASQPHRRCFGFAKAHPSPRGCGGERGPGCVRR